MTTAYNLRSTAGATGVHVADAQERVMDTGTAAGTTLATGNVTPGGAELSMVFTTPSGEPNTADWASGTYRLDVSVATTGANIFWGVKAVTQGATTINGHFARVDSGLTSDLETAVQAESDFSGTGLKQATTSWNPVSGSATDRFEVVLAFRNTDSMNQAASITVDSGVSFATWDGAGAPPPASAIAPPVSAFVA